MSNMLRKGKRIAARKSKKEVKGHTKEFYKILGELDEVAEAMLSKEDVMKDLTEENLEEVASDFTDLELGNLELLILKGKLGLYEAMENQINKAKEEHPKDKARREEDEASRKLTGWD